MRILRNLLYTVVVVGGIVLASVNMTPVRFVYLPPFAFLPRPEGAEAEVPLALLILASLLVGTLIAGTGTFVEHVRLRLAVRRQAKVVKGLRADLDKAKKQLEEARTSLEIRAAELSGQQARAKRAEEATAEAQAATAEAQAAKAEALERAAEAERRLPAPPVEG